MRLDRRSFVAGSLAGMVAEVPALATGADRRATAALAPFASAYMAAQNAPGMIVAIADRAGWSETASYGFADLEARRPIGGEERFHIGSITKSFTALMILQLVGEGRLALDADVTRYLPDLPLKTPFGAVTLHHLLCHTSGLPGEAPAIGAGAEPIVQAYAPGKRFHYSNLAYEWLGRIVVARGGEAWGAALHRRVLDPLGMTQTSPLIGPGMRRWEVPSYVRREDDRPFPRRGALTRAGRQTFTAASGCIASTAADMARYVAAIANRGVGPRGPLLPAALFDLMVTRHVAAAEFGPKGGYGYGWMTDEVDGRAVIRHTGGMESFMSSVHVDLRAGCGAFASINAQQNYRPVPVTAQALRIARARAVGAALPVARTFDPDAELSLADYVGDYAGEGGEPARVSAAGRVLSLDLGGRRLTLESLGDDKFACLDPRDRLFTILFRRARPAAEAGPDAANPVRTLEWGRDLYLRRGATVPAPPGRERTPPPAAALRAYEGLYVADGGWLTGVRVVVRGGRLWLDSFDGVTPLAALGDGRFRFADEADSPELATFSAAGVTPRTLTVSGNTLAWVAEPFAEIG